MARPQPKSRPTDPASIQRMQQIDYGRRMAQAELEDLETPGVAELEALEGDDDGQEEAQWVRVGERAAEPTGRTGPAEGDEDSADEDDDPDSDPATALDADPDDDGSDDGGGDGDATSGFDHSGIPGPLRSLAAVCNDDTANALAGVNLARDFLTVIPQQRPGSQGAPIGPLSCTVAPRSGLLEELLTWFHEPYFELQFLRPGARVPYLRVVLKRANCEAAPVKAPEPPPVSKRDPVAVLLARQNRLEGLLEDVLTRGVGGMGGADPMSALGNRVMEMLAQGFGQYVNGMSQRMAKDFGTAKAEKARGLADIVREYREVKALLSDMGDDEDGDEDGGEEGEDDGDMLDGLGEIADLMGKFGGGGGRDTATVKALEALEADDEAA